MQKVRCSQKKLQQFDNTKFQIFFTLKRDFFHHSLTVLFTIDYQKFLELRVVSHYSNKKIVLLLKFLRQSFTGIKPSTTEFTSHKKSFSISFANNLEITIVFFKS